MNRRIVTLNDFKEMLPISRELDEYVEMYLFHNMEKYGKMWKNI